jgi:hypothetical protein
MQRVRWKRIFLKELQAQFLGLCFSTQKLTHRGCDYFAEENLLFWSMFSIQLQFEVGYV